MNLKTYLYKGPQSGVQLRVGEKNELLEVVLSPGKPVDLPEDHPYTQSLLALKRLEPVPVEEAEPAGDKAPAAPAAGAKSKEAK